MKNHLKFGIIGAGAIGRFHIAAYQNGGYTVAAIADPMPEALDRARELVPGATLYHDWRDLLRDPNIDAVNICTINSLHFDILREAIASGKHVFCEKTLTINATQAQAASQLSLLPGQVVQAGYMKRFFPASQQAKLWLQEIGTPLCATVRSFQGGWSDESMFNDPAWRPSEGQVSRTQQFASGGMLNMAGSHMLDMTAWLLGAPESVMCHTWAPEGYDAELHSHALFKMKSGTLVHFEAALSNFTKTGTYENGWDEYIQIDGTKGRIEIYYPLWNRPTERAARARIYRESLKAWEELPPVIADPFQLEMAAFAQACAGEPSDYPTLADGLLVDFWIDACYQSAKTGQTISL